MCSVDRQVAPYEHWRGHCSVDYERHVETFPRSRLTTTGEAVSVYIIYRLLKLNFRKYPAMHTNYITPKAPLYNIIIIVDTVFRQKRNFKHEKQLCQQYRHIAT